MVFFLGGKISHFSHIKNMILTHIQSILCEKLTLIRQISNFLKKKVKKKSG